MPLARLNPNSWLMVAALNLFHPTVSLPFLIVGFFHIATQCLEGEGKRACE